MPSVSIVYRKDKLNKSKEAPVHFRIIKDRKISYISSGIIVPEDNWDFKKNRIKAKHTNSARLNSFLSNKFTELQDEVFEHVTVTKSLSSRQLKDKIYGKKPTDFFAFADKVLAEYEANGKIGTYDNNRSIITKLKEYVGDKEISFQDITPEFLTTYERYLKTEKKNNTNTVHKDYKFLRKVFNDAYRQDLIEYQVNPFTKYKMKSEKSEKVYLTEDELELIATCKVTSGTRLELHRDMFVFAAYTGGLRVSDVLQLQWKDFDGTFIHITIRKTGAQLSIKVPDRALAIIRKYKPTAQESFRFIFRMLPESIDLTNPRELDNEISGATAYVNKNLNIIAGKAEIGKHISFHTSRHTWATRALRKGISLDKVSKLMGHSTVRETQVYAKIVNSELDKAMDVFND